MLATFWFAGYEIFCAFDDVLFLVRRCVCMDLMDHSCNGNHQYGRPV